jgi:hypothetical protein
MKILVPGGSPKGGKSVTMQCVRFLEREEAIFAELVHERGGAAAFAG